MSVTVDLSGQLRRGTRGAPMFSDLSPYFRVRAELWFERLAARWEGRLPGWRKAVLVGQAKRLARMPDASLPGWGRRMLARRAARARWGRQRGAKA